LSCAGTVYADAVPDWNLQGATAIISPAPTGAGKPAALGLVDLAIVEIAIYEAGNAIADSPFEPSEVTPTGCAPHFCAQHLDNTRKPVLIQELLERTLRVPIVTSSVILQVAESMFRRLKGTELPSLRRHRGYGKDEAG